MILSLRFADAYRVGENERADQMRVQWARFYGDLPAYEKRLRELEAVDLQELIGGAVRKAQTWLPAGWKISGFLLCGRAEWGSPAFSVDGSQGYDFFQLPKDERGRIDLNREGGAAGRRRISRRGTPALPLHHQARVREGPECGSRSYRPVQEAAASDSPRRVDGRPALDCGSSSARRAESVALFDRRRVRLHAQGRRAPAAAGWVGR
jgi:hypothetical protein